MFSQYYKCAVFVKLTRQGFTVDLSESCVLLQSESSASPRAPTAISPIQTQMMLSAQVRQRSLVITGPSTNPRQGPKYQCSQHNQLRDPGNDCGAPGFTQKIKIYPKSDQETSPMSGSWLHVSSKDITRQAGLCLLQ